MNMNHRPVVLALAVLASLSLAERALAQPATLARDIRTLPDASAGASPEDLAIVGGTMFFAGRSDGEGVELWTSDGTAAGTHLLADLWPGAEGTGREPSGSSHPREFHAANGLVFFTADDGNAGREVWRTDGTASGTFLLKDMLPGPASSLAQRAAFTTLGNAVYFYASDPTHGRELWRSDGTTAGTALVIDACPDACSGSYSAEPPAVLGGFLYFRALSVGGDVLWRTDGSEAGTGPFALAARSPHGLATIGTSLYFGASDDTGSGLWVTDGTAGGTRFVKRLSPSAFDWIDEVTALGGGIVFQADDGVYGLELWRSDGTEAGTAMVKDIAPGPTGSYPHELTAVGAAVYFSAFDGQNGFELWRSDGTAAGTASFHLLPGVAGSRPTGLVASGGQLAFLAGTSIGDRLFWSDGTVPGTRAVGAVSPVRDLFGRSIVVATAAGVFFNGESGSGAELWRSDGTDAGTAVVRDHTSLSSRPRRLTGLDERVVLTAQDDANGREPWASDGSAAGTVLLGDLCAGACSSIPADSYDTTLQTIARLPHAAVFAATQTNLEPWTTDGTPAGTYRIGASPGSAGILPQQLTRVGDRVFYTAIDTAAAGGELWSTDGTAAGTAVVRDIHPGTGTSNPRSLTAVGDRLFFTATDGVLPTGLWTSDGTAAGTQPVDPTAPEVSILQGSGAGGLFFFTNGSGLRRSNGTASGTYLLPGVPTSPPPAELTDGGALLYFRMSTFEEGEELWRSDGLPGGTVPVLDLAPGPSSAHPAHLTRVGGVVYFTASDVAHGVELWRSDGTAAGTVLVKDIVPGPAGSVPSALAAVDGRLYFAAYQPATGVELWTSDGTEAGTVLVQDVRPGRPSSTPSDLAAADGRLYFVADDGTVGREPWSLPLLPSLLVAGTTRAEGDAGTQAVSVELRVEGTLSGPVVATYATQDGTAGAGTDYVAAAGTLTFVPGGPDAQPVALSILGDTTVEPDEEFLLAVSVTGGVVPVGAPAHVVILDDDSPVTVASAGGLALEGDTGETTSLAAAVRLSGPRGVPVTVDFATHDGTATAPADYAAASGTLTFAPGVVERAVDVAVRGDRTLEFDETLTVALSNAVNAQVAPGPPEPSVILEDEDASRPGRALAHGSVARGDFSTPGYFRLASQQLASYEAVLDGTGGSALPRVLRRFTSFTVGTAYGRVASLRWFDTGSAPPLEESLNVATLTGDAGTTDEVYRVRLLETTLRGPRFQNTGSNATTLILQNAGDEAVSGRANFLDGDGVLRHVEPFTIPPHGVFVKSLGDVPALSGLDGSLLVAHDGASGTVGGKAVVVDPVAGLAFDHLLTVRPR
jgi:ELWxxDGT repeat protein